uniref:Serine aminopeptidase S33 domain-containing protein n=11 Tax=Triticinae TaxID=1648030 RepID=A0A453FBD9_AEGTS
HPPCQTQRGRGDLPAQHGTTAARPGGKNQIGRSVSDRVVKTKSETERSKEKTPETKRALRPPNAMPLLHGASLRALLAGAAVAHLSSFPIVRASPCAPPQPLRLRAFASHSASEPPPPPPSSPSPSTSRVLASAAAACDCEEGAKPAICTADELHYAPVPGTEWRLALWRYRPPPEAPKRNHPLMLLSGVATNAVGFDLSPGASFARHMSMQGFDTWIVELRGAGLSTRGSELAAASTKSDMSSNSGVDKILTQKVNVVPPTKDMLTNEPQSSEVPVLTDTNVLETNTSEEPQLVTKLANALAQLSVTFSGYVRDSQLRSITDSFFDRVTELVPDASLTSLEEVADKFLGLMELPQTSAIYDQISQLSQRLVKILGEGQQNVSPRLFGWQERLSATIEDLQKQLELIISYDWDFDHYLEEDVPAAIDYIKQQSVPKDGKLLAIGHSMGGILLYAMVSKCGFEGADPELAAIVTLASSVDYTTSNSSLKLFVPLADPAEMLRVPAVPLGTLLSTTYPISSRAPYILSLLRSQISAKDMMDPELLSKLILNNFCTVPAKVLLQLATSFRDGGLRNRAGTFFFKEHLGKIKVPVLALAGDEDLICPPEAVYETVKVIPQHLVTYKVFGKPEGPHYAHYDLVGGRKAVHEVYPCIIEFLSQHDDVSS